MTPEAVSEFRIGAHSIRIEPELLLVRIVETMDLAETTEFLAFLERMHAQRGRLYLLFDATRITRMEPAVRRLFIDWMRRNPRILAAVANFGGGLLQRALAQLLASAIRLIVGFLPPQCYLESEAAARAWLSAQQARAPH